MSNTEKKIKEAFDSVVMPAGLEESTLKRIAQLRLTQESSAPAGHDSRKRTKAKRTTRLARLLRRSGYAVAACLLLVALGFGSFSVYATETALVGIEVNPSIELGVNRFDIVLAARAGNADGQQVLDTVSVEGKPYDEALELITSSEAFSAYLSEDAYVDIAVVSEDEERSEALVAVSQRRIEALPCQGNAQRASSQRHREAAQAGMGVGRYELAQTLIALDPQITLEECQHMSMKELRQKVAEHDHNVHPGSPGNATSTPQGNGSAQSQGNNASSSQGSGSSSGSQQGSGSSGAQSNNASSFPNNGSSGSQGENNRGEQNSQQEAYGHARRRGA